MATLDVVIRPVGADERAAWEPLWKGYQAFYKVVISDADHGRDLGAAARSGGADGRAWAPIWTASLCGIVHYLFHRSCWTVGDYCYLQDLFVAEGRAIWGSDAR